MRGVFNKLHLIRQVDLFTLRLFLSVIEEGQVGRAAARENIAPSAATKRIQDFEDIVGLDLFERVPRGVIPTPAGLVLARHVEHIFETLEAVRRDMGDFMEGMRGTLRIASTGALITHFLSAEIAEFARSSPRVQIDLREAPNPEVMRAVAAGEVDVAVYVASPGTADEGLDAIDWRSDQLVAVVAHEHPLAERASLTAAELLRHDFISISPATSIMAYLRRAAADHGIAFQPKFTVDSIYAATSLVRVNQGVTVEPDYMLSARDHEFVRAVPLDEPWARRRVCIVTQRGKAVSAASKSFIAQLTSKPQ